MLLKDKLYSCKWFFQKLFRFNHLSDVDIWNTHIGILKSAEKNLRAFIRLEKHGVPADVKDMEAWNDILKEILFAAEYYVIDDDFYSRKGKKFLRIYNYDDPYKEIPENKKRLEMKGTDGSAFFSDYYCSDALFEEIRTRAKAGLELFKKYLLDLWD